MYSMASQGRILIVFSSFFSSFSILTSFSFMIQCRNRWNLSHGTVFLAANYLDRFISKNRTKVSTSLPICVVMGLDYKLEFPIWVLLFSTVLADSCSKLRISIMVRYCLLQA